MKIHQLKVQNFRCFEQATFDFSPGFNLFVGVNGSGKTSLLTAVAASLATPLNGFGKTTVWVHDKEANARLALVELKGRVRYERCYPVRLEVSGEVNGEARNWWMSQAAPESPQNKWEHTVFNVFKERTAHTTLPIVAFYSAQRQWALSGATPEAAVRQQDSRLDGYVAWQDASSDTKGLETWVIAKSLERLEAVADADAALVSGIYMDELELVNTAVMNAVPGAKGLRYDMKYRRLMLDWITAQPQPTPTPTLTPFETLSDGQRGLVALVADIARRMCLLNPQLGDAVLAETSGIVVIDELDMHLHPVWQRRLPSVLKHTFPKVQFIAASHSPQIIGELSAPEVWLMRDAKVLGNPDRAFGLSSGEVLEELMEGISRNATVEAEINGIRSLLDADDISGAKGLLTALRQKVGDIPEVLELQAAIESLQWLEDDEA